MKEIILATGNAHKAHEFRDMLPNVRILTLKDLPQPVTIVEDGETFEENALKKPGLYMKRPAKLRWQMTRESKWMLWAVSLEFTAHDGWGKKRRMTSKMPG